VVWTPTGTGPSIIGRSPTDPPQGWALAAAAAVLLIGYRVSSVWLILAGGAIGVLDHYLR
jgi:hypothetical protein